MPLNETQRAELLQKTINKEPNWRISGWLHDVCGLSYKEARDERLAAIELSKPKIEEIRKQKESEFEERRKRMFQEREARLQQEKEKFEEAASRRPPDYIPSPFHPEEACVTCGDPSFTCDCTCKRHSDIPF